MGGDSGSEEGTFHLGPEEGGADGGRGQRGASGRDSRGVESEPQPTPPFPAGPAGPTETSFHLPQTKIPVTATVTHFRGYTEDRLRA